MNHLKKDDHSFNAPEKEKFANQSFNPQNSPYMKRRVSDYSGNIHLMALNSSYSFKPITSSIFPQNFPIGVNYNSPFQIANQHPNDQKYLPQQPSNKIQSDKKQDQKIKSNSQKQETTKKIKAFNTEKKDYSTSSRQFMNKLGSGKFLRTQYDNQQLKRSQKNQIPIKESMRSDTSRLIQSTEKDNKLIAELKKQIEQLKSEAQKNRILDQSHAYQELANQFIQLTKKYNHLEDVITEKDKEIEKLKKQHQSHDAQELNYTKLLLKELKFKCKDYDQKIQKLTMKCDQLELSNEKYQQKSIEDEKEKDKLKMQIQKMQIISQKPKTDEKSQKLSYSQLGESFQTKINDLIDENYRLKNSLTSANGKIEELQTRNKSFQDMLTAFEDRDKLSAEQNLFQKEIEDLTAKLEAEKDDKDRVISEYELTIMKIENFKDHEHFSKFGSLIDEGKKERILQNMKNLIAEVEDLKNKIKERDLIIKNQNQNLQRKKK